jgi:hypothetical protein
MSYCTYLGKLMCFVLKFYELNFSPAINVMHLRCCLLKMYSMIRSSSTIAGAKKIIEIAMYNYKRNRNCYVLPQKRSYEICVGPNVFFLIIRWF